MALSLLGAAFILGATGGAAYRKWRTSRADVLGADILGADSASLGIDASWLRQRMLSARAALRSPLAGADASSSAGGVDGVELERRRGGAAWGAWISSIASQSMSFRSKVCMPAF